MLDFHSEEPSHESDIRPRKPEVLSDYDKAVLNNLLPRLERLRRKKQSITGHLPKDSKFFPSAEISVGYNYDESSNLPDSGVWYIDISNKETHTEFEVHNFGNQYMFDRVTEEGRGPLTPEEKEQLLFVAWNLGAYWPEEEIPETEIRESVARRVANKIGRLVLRRPGHQTEQKS